MVTSNLNATIPDDLRQNFAKADTCNGLCRAVNQAVGRVIRHQHDYGAIILCDDRFSSDGVRSNISLWLRDRVEMIPTFGAAMVSLTAFFKACLNFCVTAAWGSYCTVSWSA